MMELCKNETGNEPGCSLGLLIMENVRNDTSFDSLRPAREELEAEIRAKYDSASRGGLKLLHPMDAYIAYYKKFGYTYHVLSQLESIIKSKSIPFGIPSVSAMFMAEIKNMLLTAGHDLDKVQLPLRLKCADGSEAYMTISGKTVSTIPEDFMLADQRGILSSILRGPDEKTAICKKTTRVIFTVYAPLGVEEQLVLAHLRDIETYVLMASKEACTQCLRVVRPQTSFCE